MLETAGSRVAIEFDLLPADVVTANIWWFFRQWFIVFIYVVNAIAAVSVIKNVLVQGIGVAEYRSLAWFCLWFLLIPLILVLSSMSSYRNLTRTGRTIRYVLSDDGFQSSTAVGSGTLQWRGLQKAIETRRSFLLFPQKKLFHVIPKRAFKDNAELVKCRALLRDNLGSKARVKA